VSAVDAPPFEVVNPNGSSHAFLLCDHASNFIPASLGSLGLLHEDLLDHIAWDIGAAEMARETARVLDATLVLSGVSRLVIDCNRPLRAPSSIPTLTGGVTIPGNIALAQRDREDRAEKYFWPYHHTIERLLAARAQPTSILSMHSFTSKPLNGPRPWHAGMVYGRDRTLAAHMLETLRNDRAVVVGDNEPYRVTDEGDYGIPTYAERAGRPGVLVEVRQDLLATQDDARAWGRRIAEAFRRFAQ
jgi:predicted N-formylglutamate amidohydrolase